MGNTALSDVTTQLILLSGKETHVMCMHLSTQEDTQELQTEVLYDLLSLEWYWRTPWPCFDLLKVLDRDDAIESLRQNHLVV